MSFFTFCGVRFIVNSSKPSYFHFLQYIPNAKNWWKDPLFLGALGLAIVLHLALVSVQFVAGQSAPMATKDVSVAVTLSKDEVEEADFLAQADQKGDGTLKQAHAQTTPVPMSAPDTQLGESQQETLEQLAQKKQLDFQERMLMTTLSWQKQSQDDEKKDKMHELEQQVQANATMIASIEAQYTQRQQMYAKKQKVKTVTGIQAKQDASATYLDKFRQKVETFGNRYYPEEAKQRKLSGDVRLMVILNAQGGIRAIRLLESSGHNVLDEAAKASVRRAMPFGRFDEGMKDITELRIVRTWRFDPQDSVFDVQ